MIGVRLRGWDLGFAAVIAVLLAAYAGARAVLYRNRPQRADVPVTPAAETFVASSAALALLLYRLLDRPTVPGGVAERTNWLVAVAAVALLQTVFAGRKLARTGLRATPPAP